MNAKTFRPWTDIVSLHPDVEARKLTESAFAIDLGAVAENDPNVPVVYRDPHAFFRATYLTADLRRLLHEVLASLSGKPGYNRVLKLRTPFGGGKSHTLAALLHAARNRSALDILPEVAGLDDPGRVDTAVFDGEKYDALRGRTLDDGRVIRTMWGWIAWQFGEEKYRLVADHDQKLVAPGGDVIRELLSGTPKLILLDEVLKYMERAAAVPALDSTLQRQTKDFFQSLTVEVTNSTNAVLVYSLQQSSREALGNIALLQEIDTLANRVDQLREPVSGDEILPVLKRRLLASEPPKDVAMEVAEAYAQQYKNQLIKAAQTEYERQQVEEKALLLRDRIVAAYPFHPDLIDLMKERWASVDAFQRTRGALRFLAACLSATKQSGSAKALLGPADVPMEDGDVRVQIQKELGLQNEYDAVIASDIAGPNARAKRIDERLSRNDPALNSVRPAFRLATAIFMYSFGGLRREADGAEEMLPPGITEVDLLRACLSPELDYVTAKAALGDLRNECLYLHFDGARYCFKKDPNVTKLIEDAEQEVTRDPEAVNERIREILNGKLAGHPNAFVWPKRSSDLPDMEPRFIIGFLPLEFASKKSKDQESEALMFFSNCGDNKPRRYRNGIGLAVPDNKNIESLRRAVRYLMAVEKVEKKKDEFRLTKSQLDQLRERKATEESAKESALRQLYNAVWLPVVENGSLAVEKLEVGGRPLQSNDIYGRIIELLTTVGTPKLFSSIHPRKIIERMKLGEASEGERTRLGVTVKSVVDTFYEVIEPPRLESANVLKRAIVQGVQEKLFGYYHYSGSLPQLGDDGKYKVPPENVFIGRPITEDEIDVDSGFLMLPSAIPTKHDDGKDACPVCGQSPCVCGKVCSKCGQYPCVCPDQKCPVCGQWPCVCAVPRRTVSIRFRATRAQVYKAFPAVANLADKSDDEKVTIQVMSSCAEGFDPTWLRNAVEEPLREADIEIYIDTGSNH
ncbi:MAG: DUF499 domain-containing protein [Armatimonadota bacterium]|nr:DUF499 domain-containing protein [Armatimonadota bacterium]